MSSTPIDVSREIRAEEMFYLDGKTLRLLRPLDRDENDLSSVIFQVKCYDPGSKFYPF